MSSIINRIPKKIVLPNSVIDCPIPVNIINPVGQTDDLGRLVTTKFDRTFSVLCESYRSGI